MSTAGAGRRDRLAVPVSSGWARLVPALPRAASRGRRPGGRGAWRSSRSSSRAGPGICSGRGWTRRPRLWRASRISIRAGSRPLPPEHGRHEGPRLCRVGDRPGPHRRTDRAGRRRRSATGSGSGSDVSGLKRSVVTATPRPRSRPRVIPARRRDRRRLNAPDRQHEPSGQKKFSVGRGVMLDVTVIEDPAAAAVSLDPIRAQLLAELAAGPASAAMLSGRVGLPRQKVNYHLKALEQHGLVELAGERRKGNVTERLMRRRRVVRHLAARPRRGAARPGPLPGPALGPLAARVGRPARPGRRHAHHRRHEGARAARHLRAGRRGVLRLAADRAAFIEELTAGSAP